MADVYRKGRLAVRGRRKARTMDKRAISCLSVTHGRLVPTGEVYLPSST